MTKEQIVTNFRIIMASNCMVSQKDLVDMMMLTLDGYEAREANAEEASFNAKADEIYNESGAV